MDAAVLQTSHDVRKVEWRGRASAWELRRVLREAHLVLSWFAGDHAAVAAWLARRLRRPSILVAGGADVARLPEIGYGAMAGSLKSRFATWYSLRQSSIVLPFSRFSSEEVARVSRTRRMEVLPLGVDVRRFAPAGEKQSLVATVANVNRTNLHRKGLLSFVRAASLVSEARFVVAGAQEDDAIVELRKMAPPNVDFAGRLAEDDLLALYRRSKVYVQASAHEGFGLALAEAMACECIPVVADRGSIPEVVGETGRYVPYGDPLATATAIREALASPPAMGAAARQRIRDLYPFERRAVRLLALVEELVAGGAA